jgi:hypothetical protein
MDEPLCPCHVVVVLDYNPERDGEPPKPVEPEVMAQVHAMLTALGPISTLGWSGVGDTPRGLWEGHSDRSVRFEVSLPQARTPAFIEVVRRIGFLLKQKAMYYVIGPPSAFVMTIEQEQGSN